MKRLMFAAVIWDARTRTLFAARDRAREKQLYWAATDRGLPLGPELKALPDKFLHAPWEAPEHIRLAAGVRLGTDYPAPVVDHAAARQRALDAYASLRRESSGA